MTIDEYKSFKLTKSNIGILYRGVIEDNNDPDKLGRVKVRVFGVHTDNKDFLKTEDLPWALVIGTANKGLISGIGESSVPEQGNYVFVIFEDNDYNKPLIIGTCTGIYTNNSTGKAFQDKDSIFPLIGRINESDMNRLSRNENYKLTTLYLKRDNSLSSFICNDIHWSQPTELNTKTVYPYNKVQETKSGHIIEIDDTDGNERIHVYHKSGTFIEIRPDGTISTHIMKDNYERVKGSEYKAIEKNKVLLVKGHSDTQIDGILTETINTSASKTVTGNYTVQAANIYLN